MIPQRMCKELCKKFKVKKPAGQSRYGSGHGRCQTCDIWVNHNGAHTKYGEPATKDSKGWYCNCCNRRIRKNPRHTKYKVKLRSTNNATEEIDNSGFYNEVDLSYFNKKRARIIKQIAQCIPFNKNDFNKHKFEESLIRYDIPIVDVESEFNTTIKNIIDLAYATNPPNKISMIVELERIHAIMGDIPTKQEFEEHSHLKIFQYDDEFETWGNLLERLNYDPFYRNRKNRKTKNEGSVSVVLDKPEKKHLQDTPIQTSTDVLNQQIKQALHLIKSSPNGSYLSDLRKLLEISQEAMFGLVMKLISIDGVSRREIRHDGTLLDIVLSYEEPEKHAEKYKPKLFRNELGARTNQCVAENVAYDIHGLTQDMLNEYAMQKKYINCQLQISLINEYFTSKSIGTIMKNHPELSKEDVKIHLRTPLRLPGKLKILNAEGLHSDPEISLHIALYATNYYDWDGQGDEDRVVHLAKSIAKQIMPDALSKRSTRKSHSKLGKSDRVVPTDIIVSTPIAVWIATAALQMERGTDAIFSNQEIMEKVLQQRICNVSCKTVEAHITNHCVANVSTVSASTHRKIIRVASGAYRLYKKGDPYHHTRERGWIAPLKFQLPNEYKDLRRWYDDEYCSS